MESKFTEDVIKRFDYYKGLGDKTFNQLEEKDFFYQPNESTNSIAMIIQHMYGNMLSRWTNFLTEDGEKEWRNRDAEFEVNICSKQDLISFWNEGWNCMYTTLKSLQPADLEKTIYIRSEPIVVFDALLRQLAHYPYHVGQIVYLGCMIKEKKWLSLSIPKNGSQSYNESMKEKHQ